MNADSRFIAAVATFSFVAGSCGHLTVDRDLLADVSIKQKLELFEAENEVSMALDDSEQTQRDIYEKKLELIEAEDNLEYFEDDIRHSLSKGTPNAAEISRQARKVEDNRIGYLRAELASLRLRQEMQRCLIDVAMAKFELAKAKLVKRSNLRGASGMELNDFEAQVDEYIAFAKDAQGKFGGSERVVKKAKDVWLKARSELHRSSGGSIGSPWSESADEREGL